MECSTWTFGLNAIRIDQARVEGRATKWSARRSSMINGLWTLQHCLATIGDASVRQALGLGRILPRSLHTKAGEVKLNVPKLRSLPFETQIIERYKGGNRQSKKR